MTRRQTVDNAMVFTRHERPEDVTQEFRALRTTVDLMIRRQAGLEAWILSIVAALAALEIEVEPPPDDGGIGPSGPI